MKCPYPDCSTTLKRDLAQVCECEYRNPINVCGRCGVVCRAGARFCRACRAELPTARMDRAGTGQVQGPDFLFVSGSFHTGPQAYGSFLWALSDDGAVYRL